MELWQIATIGAGLLLLILILRRVASGQDRGKAILPSKIGQDLGIEDILEKAVEYNIYYSGKDSTPAAIIFIPKDTRIIWELKQGLNWWKPIQDEAGLKEIIDALHRQLDAVQTKARLRVLVPPPSLKPYDSQPAYLYSGQLATPKRIAGSHPRVSLRAIKEIRHSGGIRR
ncbi:MAG: hypothetical protein ACLFSY_03795 [Desulfonatronovibrionaceae bacterium]